MYRAHRRCIGPGSHPRISRTHQLVSMQKDRSEETMSNFTPSEIEYLNNQRLGRLATVNVAGEPHVVPVGFRYNAEFDSIDIGGVNLCWRRKNRDASRRRAGAFLLYWGLPPPRRRRVERNAPAAAFPPAGRSLVPHP